MQWPVYSGWPSRLITSVPTTDLTLLLLAGVAEGDLLIEEVLGEGDLLLGGVHGEGDLLLAGVLAGVLLLGLGGELLPEPELGLLLLEEMDLDLFLTLLAGLRSAEASVAPAAVVVLLEDGVGSSASFLLLGGIHPFGERSSSTCSAKRTS